MTIRGVSTDRNTAITTISIMVVLYASRWRLLSRFPLFSFMFEGFINKSVLIHLLTSPACSALTLLAISFCLLLSAFLMAENRRMLRMTRDTQGTRWTHTTRNLAVEAKLRIKLSTLKVFTDWQLIFPFWQVDGWTRLDLRLWGMIQIQDDLTLFWFLNIKENILYATYTYVFFFFFLPIKAVEVDGRSDKENPRGEVCMAWVEAGVWIVNRVIMISYPALSRPRHLGHGHQAVADFFYRWKHFLCHAIFTLFVWQHLPDVR